MDVKTIPLVVYSHSSYFDCLDLCINQLHKYKFTNITLFCDQEYKNIPTIKYLNSESYSERIKGCLSQYSEDHFLFIHEDFLLYSQPNMEKLFEYFELVKENNISSLRLLRSGVHSIIPRQGQTLYKIESKADCFFAIQASLFSKHFLLALCNNFSKLSIWELEQSCQDYASKFSNYVHYDYEKKRGLAHYDSNIFPYTATAINKGKWSREYFSELSKLHSDYQIDSNKRGW